MQQALIKSSRSCTRGRERADIPLSLWQSLSQIKVRFGARENNFVRARTRIPRARPSLDSEYLFGEPDLSLPPRSPRSSPTVRMYACRLNIASCMGTRASGYVLGIILSKISKDIRTADSFAIPTACGSMPFFDSLLSRNSARDLLFAGESN